MFRLCIRHLSQPLVGILLCCALCNLGVANTEATAGQAAKRFSAITEPKDPTQPPTFSRRQASSDGKPIKGGSKLPVLTSILTSDQRRLAVINGKLVREGELIAGMTLVRVDKDAVHLQRIKQTQAQTGTLVLRLPKSNIGKDYR